MQYQYNVGMGVNSRRIVRSQEHNKWEVQLIQQSTKNKRKEINKKESTLKVYNV